MPRIDELLIVSESIADIRLYQGTPISMICASLGIKELEFYEIRVNSKEVFDEKYKLGWTRLSHKDVKTIFRLSTIIKLQQHT